MPFHTPAERAKNRETNSPTRTVQDKEIVLKAAMANVLAPESPNRMMKAKKSTVEIR